MGLLFLCCLLSIPLGMGLAKLLMATLLEKSNVVGNSLTDTKEISSPIKDIKIEPVAEPARDQAGSVPPPPAAPKRSWNEAVDDSFMDMDEKDS